VFAACTAYTDYEIGKTNQEPTTGPPASFRPTQSWPPSLANRAVRWPPSIGAVGPDAPHGVLKLVDLITKMIACLRIDNGDWG
jgi:hypothetical protein